ncbi:bidirectional sugar transporter SWEET1-like [Nymphaea colorata]|nr:bidirectional sugar transporter SWEET1-like [Nymphaea colorata]
MKEVSHLIFGAFGNATALFLFLVPSITFKRIIKKQSTENFSGAPYVATLLNCLLSAWYGLPFVSPHNLLVSTVNGAGVAIESVYVLLFLIFAVDGKARVKVGRLLCLVLLLFSGVVLVSMLALRGQHRKIFCGFAATIFSICMYASPLGILRLVVKTKSVEYMPFLLSLFVFLCGTSWFIYGLLGGDPFLIVPNGFGCGLGALQLIIYAIYKDWGGGGDGEKKTVVNSSSSRKEGGDECLKVNGSDCVTDDAMEMGHMKHETKTTNMV